MTENLSAPALSADELAFLARLAIKTPVIMQPPARLAASAWAGHIPFAFWIMDILKPVRLVELGVHNGVSFAAFCQQAAAQGRGCQCYGVDTWQGDEQAFFYGEEVFQDISSFINANFFDFAHLVRSTFDEAAAAFRPGDIDLLHIDGLHTREAMLHDFETWLPSMSDSGVVLMHDINARLPGYGGIEIWPELAARFPHFAFDHSHGLGMLLVGPNPHPELLALTSLSPQAGAHVRSFFSHAGAYCQDAVNNQLLREEVEKAHVKQLRHQEEEAAEHARKASQAAECARQEWEKREQAKIAEQVAAREPLYAEITRLNGIIAEYANSKSWRLTEPLRVIGGMLRHKQ